jgi:hypothetical protein
MNRADKYRRSAAECFAVAQHLADPYLKATMLEMARSWTALAERTEQGGDPDPGYRTTIPDHENHIQ